MHKCQGCSRTFGGKRALKLHENKCLYYEAPKKLNVPSMKEMWGIILELKESVTVLERKIKDLKTPAGAMTSFSIWKRGWVVSDTQMKFLLDSGYHKGVTNILCMNIMKDSPIKYMKKNIYIFEKGKWTYMTDADFCTLIAHVQQKIAGAFIKWQKMNPDIVNGMDGTFERYMMEAFGGTKNSQTSNQLILKDLLQYCRTLV